jgi:hypothetical protein
MAFFHPNTSHVPVEASFHPPEHSDTHIQSKSLYYCYPENKQDKGPNDILRFHISTPTKLLDTRSLAFFFTFKAGANKDKDYAEYADTLIKSLKVSFNNSQTVEFIEDYHRLHNVLKPYVMTKEPTSTHEMVLQGPASWFNNASAATDRQICLKFSFSGILGINKYLPMDSIGTLDLEIRLASSEEHEDKSFTIKQPYLTMDTYKPSLDYTNALSNIIDNQGIVLEYPTFTHFSRILHSTRDEIILHRNIRSAKAIFIIASTSADENRLQGALITNSFLLPAGSDTGLTSYRLAINGQWETHQPIKLGANDVEYYYETLKAFDLHGLDREFLHYPQCGEVIAYNLEKSSLMSGTQIKELKLELNSNGSNAIAYHVYIYHDAQVLISSGRQFMTQY